MNKYKIYCTEEQTRKALELGAPIVKVDTRDKRLIYFGNLCYPKTEADYPYAISAAEQMIGYLRTRGFKFSFDDIYNYWAVLYDLKIINKGNSNDKELAAIDAALEYLISNKK